MSTEAAPRIKEIRVRALRVPMSEPHQTASGAVVESPLVLTEVITDGGVVGRSTTFTYTNAALRPTAELVNNIGQLICGEEVAPAQLAQSLASRFRLLGQQGLVGMALAALDMALWDAHAHVHSLPLVRLLGSKPAPVRAYASVGYGGVAGSVSAAAEWAAQGFRGVKVKIGYPTVEEDLAVVRGVRKQLGDDFAVMVDYNQCLTPAEAVQRLRVLDGEGLTWIEEPTLAHDYTGHAQIARETRTPIQCGENWWGVLDLQHGIDAQACDYLMADVMKIGGVTGWLRMAAIASAHAIPVSSHLWPELSARLLCCTPTAHWLEYANWWNPVIAEPLRVEDGFALVDDSPGSGLAWNDAAVEQYTV